MRVLFYSVICILVAIVLMLTSHTTYDRLAARDVQYGQHQGPWAKVLACTVLVQMKSSGGSGHGSGVIIEKVEDRQYRILTCKHIRAIYDQMVSTYGSATLLVSNDFMNQEVVGQWEQESESSDLATLTILWSEHELPVADLAPSRPFIGDDLKLCGYPGSPTIQMLTDGCLGSYKGKLTQLEKNWIVTCGSWAGHSGGGIWNEKQQLVAINRAGRWFRRNWDLHYVGWYSACVRLKDIRAFLGALKCFKY